MAFFSLRLSALENKLLLKEGLGRPRLCTGFRYKTTQGSRVQDCARSAPSEHEAQMQVCLKNSENVY